MLTIMYLILLINGQFYLEPVIEFQYLEDCFTVREMLLEEYPEYSLVCMEYREA